MDTFESDVKKYNFFRRFVCKLICKAFGYSAPLCAPECGPMLVVSNHNTDLDPVFLAMSFKEHMYFVASEHVFRWGAISKFIVGMFHPIARRKGMTDAASAMQIMRTLRQGHHVCLFAEGNRSFNGVTGPVFPATGKLARSAKAALVTFRIHGGYLTTPRWAHKRRHGRMTGEPVHVYTNDELRRMTDDEIQQAITRDLYEDAFERQKSERIPFTGKRLAEGLENALYICPSCGATGTLAGKGDTFRCDCGLSVTYDTYGFFEGENVPFSNVRDWDIWQTERMRDIAAESILNPDAVVFSDADQRLLRLNPDHGMTEIDRGILSVCGNALSVGDTSIPLSSISDMAIVGPNNIVFSAGNDSYEISARKGHRCCGRKYCTFFSVRKTLSRG